MSKHYKWQADWQRTEHGQWLHVPSGLTWVGGGHFAGDSARVMVKHGPHNFPHVLQRLAREAAALELAHLRGVAPRHARLL